MITTYPVDSVERRLLPPVPETGSKEFFSVDTYAVVSAGAITAEVLRLAYWDPRDGKPDAEVIHEVRINGIPETGGTADIVAEGPEPLIQLAAVASVATELLSEVSR